MDELARKFAEVAERYAPDVVDALLMAARIEGLSAMAGGVLGLVIAYALYRAGRHLWRKAKVAGHYDGDSLYIIGGVSYLCSGLAGCLGIWGFLDPWVWIALTRPELYIAKKVLGL